MKTIARTTMLILLMILLCSSLTYAVGVAPARKVIDYSQGSSEVELILINNQHKDMKAVVFAKGELSQYISFDQTLYTISSGDEHTRIRYSIDLPSDIGKPGIHTAQIVIMEFPSEFASESQTKITAVGAVESQLHVRVPYPGKYAEAKMYISDPDVGKQAGFSIQMFNFGKDSIEKAKATIEIFGATYERIGTIQTDEISIGANKEGKLSAAWLADVNPGVYHAVAMIDYDGQKIRVEENFNVGKLTVEIKSIEVKDFSLGQVAKFDIFVENRWNSDIPTVYADLQIMDKQGSILTQFKTESITLPALSTQKIRAYWDTEGTIIGTYDAKIILNYAGKTTERLFEIDVNIDSLTARSPVAHVIKTSSAMNKESILIILIIVLVLINVGWLVYIKRKK